MKQLLVLLLCITVQLYAAAGKLQIYVLDVDQGDAILIRCPHGDHELLIDSGEPNKVIRDRFMAQMAEIQQPANPIEMVLLTHPHEDHFGNMTVLCDAYKVKTFVENGHSAGGAGIAKVFKKFDDEEHSEHLNMVKYKGDLAFCPAVKMTFLRHKGFEKNVPSPNDRSLVIRLDYGERSFLFTGDAEGIQEKAIMADPATRALLDVDFLKVGHHGSKTSSSDAFLGAVTPDLAVISAGGKDGKGTTSFCLPDVECVKRIIAKLNGNRPETSFYAFKYFSKEQLDAIKEKYKAETGKAQLPKKMAGQWSKVNTKKALYTTMGDGKMLFESDGHDIKAVKWQ
jgi:competence protein ComEC